MPHLHPCSHLQGGGGCCTSSPSSLAAGSHQALLPSPPNHVLMAASTSTAPRSGHPVLPSSEAGSSLAHVTGTGQRGHPKAQRPPRSPLPHSTRPTRPNPAPCCSENSSPAPNPQTLPAAPQRGKGTHRAEVPGCRRPVPHAAAGSGEGAWPVSQLSWGCQSPASPFGPAPARTLTLPTGDLAQTRASSSHRPRTPLSPWPPAFGCRMTRGPAPRALAGSWAAAGGWWI